MRATFGVGFVVDTMSPRTVHHVERLGMSLLLGFIFFVILGLAVHPAWFVFAGICLLIVFVAEVVS